MSGPDYSDENIDISSVNKKLNNEEYKKILPPYYSSNVPSLRNINQIHNVPIRKPSLPGTFRFPSGNSKVESDKNTKIINKVVDSGSDDEESNNSSRIFSKVSAISYSHTTPLDLLSSPVYGINSHGGFTTFAKIKKDSKTLIYEDEINEDEEESISFEESEEDINVFDDQDKTIELDNLKFSSLAGSTLVQRHLKKNDLLKQNDLKVKVNRSFDVKPLLPDNAMLDLSSMKNSLNQHYVPFFCAINEIISDDEWKMLEILNYEINKPDENEDYQRNIGKKIKNWFRNIFFDNELEFRNTNFWDFILRSENQEEETNDSDKSLPYNIELNPMESNFDDDKTIRKEFGFVSTKIF